MKTLHKAIAILILVANIYFLYATIGIIRTAGGPMGWGYLVLPFTVSANLLIVPAVMVLQKRFEGYGFLTAINALGLLAIMVVVSLLFFRL
ncbi:hypothetical protein ACI6PS_14665 [Flavobacterium sp. PLA-1-15]|uniref:hypothetical protein n=1 Tax=Flavobacterium sp. PLA-1-15 TaxID=3380533 RepID=UPI003B79B19B